MAINTTHSETFKKLNDSDLLARMVTAQNELLPMIQELAERAMVRLSQDNPDARLLTNLYNALHNNAFRKEALTKWAVAHAPVKFERREDQSWHFVIDKDRCDAVDLEAAFENPFWDWAPAAKPKEWSAAAMRGEIEGIIKRYAKAANKIEDADTSNDIRDAVTRYSKALGLGLPEETASTERKAATVEEVCAAA